MNVTPEVILDLLPAYLSGEASQATRTLVEEHMKEDAELAQRVRLLLADNLAKAAPPVLRPELELRSLRRTQSLLAWQRWLFGLGIFFSAMLLSNEFSFEGGHFKEFHFLLRDYPAEFGICVRRRDSARVACFSIRRRLRTGTM